MLQGRKRNHGRSSWWTSVKDAGNWLSAVRADSGRKATVKADARTGSRVNARQIKDGLP